MLRVLFFGDVMGSIGRKAMNSVLPKLKSKYKADFVITNAENLAHGKGVTTKTLDQLKNAGVDFFTSGNHVYSKGNSKKIFDSTEYDIIAPENDPRTPRKSGYKMITVGKNKLFILNLLGRTFINERNIECPFKTFDKIYKKIKELKPDFTILDFHAEATSEKVAMGHYVDGKIDALIGTHTHIQTNDARMLPNNTLYVTDIGMVGAKESVIGIEKEIIIDKFIKNSKIVFDLPKNGEAIISGVYLELDKNQKNSTIKLINEFVKIK